VPVISSRQELPLLSAVQAVRSHNDGIPGGRHIDAFEEVLVTVTQQQLVNISKRCFVRSTRRTSNLITRTFNDHLRPAGLESTQFWILCAIEMNMTRSMTELADYLGIEGSTLQRNMQRMIELGLVVASPGVGRRILHRLTEQGSDKLDAALPLWREVQDELEGLLVAVKADRIRRDLGVLSDAAKVLVVAAG
jgi:DNA-binding MarR family transcriptional regulator